MSGRRFCLYCDHVERKAFGNTRIERKLGEELGPRCSWSENHEVHLPPPPWFLPNHNKRACVSGNPQWEAAEEAIHQIVTHSDDEYSLTYEDLKRMLDWKDRLEELSVKCSTLVSVVPTKGGGTLLLLPVTRKDWSLRGTEAFAVMTLI